MPEDDRGRGIGDLEAGAALARRQRQKELNAKAAATRAANKAKREAHAAAKRAEAAIAAEVERTRTRVHDVFGDPGGRGYNADRMYLRAAPSCINDIVEVERWRVTVEFVPEPADVIRARLVKLWREDEYNHHHVDPMWRAAQDLLGITRDEVRALLKLDEHGIDNPRNKERR